MTIWKRLRQWRRRAQFEAGLEEEMRFHREMSGPAAFGSMALALEDSRAVWSFGWLESLARDIRYALRGFRKSPGFVLAVVGTIGAALGLNTTLFTVFNAYALRPFAVRDPWSLYEFSWYGKNGQGHRFTWAQYRNFAALEAPFSGVMATESLLGEVEGRTLFGQLVSGNYFTMLGAGVVAGRPLLPRDAATPGSGAVMVIGYEAWKNKFGGDPNLLGKTLHLRGHAFEVVGIANPGFAGLESLCAFWIPVTMHDAVADGPGLLAVPLPEALRLIGRLQPLMPPETARAALMAALAGADSPAAEIPVGVVLQSRATSVPLTRDAIITFIPIFTAFGLVLLIACANVSNMMLARGLARQREIVIRISLGAGRARLVRQLLTESVLLALPAAALGFVVSQSTIVGARRLLFATAPGAFARILVVESLTPDWRVFAFILLASILATLMFGMTPAIQIPVFRIPVLRGRAFTDSESEAGAPVAVVSESAARRLWPDAEAIGQTVSLPRDNSQSDGMPSFSEARVIGVARDVLSYLANSADRQTAMIYFPTSRNATNNESVVVRLRDTSGARRRIAAALDGIAPSLYDMLNPMDDVLAMQIYPFQVTFWIAAFLGGMALLMTISGIYGVLSFLVSQRTKEIGIRVALGASAADVVRMVVRQSARLALIGVTVGVALALAIAPIFAHQIEAIHPYDAFAYFAAMVAVMLAALAASLAPSRRAVRSDPVTALRCD